MYDSKVTSIARKLIEVGDSLTTKEQVLDAIQKARQHARISDIHLDKNEPLAVRLDGELIHQETIISPGALEEFITEHRPPDHEKQILECGSWTSIVSTEETKRLRLTVFSTGNSHVAAIRLLPDAPPTLDELGLPDVFRQIAKRRSGLSILAGPVGVGKSTSLAGVTEEINATQRALVYTIDDAQEYVFKNKRGRVRQIRVGVGGDVPTYAAALASLLRGDPNKIIVSECRTPDAIAAALLLAEAGRHVLLTLHLESATSVVDRIVGAFPAQEQANIRVTLAGTLQDVVYMRLPRRITPTEKFGRVPACEILMRDDGLSTAILTDAGSKAQAESTEAALRNYIRGHREAGMQLLEDHLQTLVEDQIITKEAAYDEAIRPKELETTIGRVEKRSSQSMFNA
jgi:twitching motility protein PilT